jgi:hypothetical protein
MFLAFRLGDGILTTFFYSGSGILLILSLLILPEGIKGGGPGELQKKKKRNKITPASRHC